MGRIRSWLAVIKRTVVITVVLLAVLAMPVLALSPWRGLFHSTPNRNATPLPQFQARAIDQTTAAPQIFKQPLITVTFDDGWETTYKDAMPLLQKYGIVTTQYIISGVEKYPGYMSWDQIKALEQNGEEIACHTVTHPHLTQLSQSQIMYQLQGCKDQIYAHTGILTTDFATPYSDYNAQVLADIRQVFASHRNTNGDPSDGVNSADVNVSGQFDPYNIIGVTIERYTPEWQIQELIDYTVKHNGWLVLVYHQADDGPSPYGIDPKSLNSQLSIVSKAPARIVTVSQALQSYRQELAR